MVTLWLTLGAITAMVLMVLLVVVFVIFSDGSRDRERARREREAWERLERGLAAGDAAKGREPDDVLRENDGRWK